MDKKRGFLGPLIILVVAILSLICYPKHSMAQDSIQWIDLILPPIHHIEEGTWKGEGVTDNLTQLLKEKLKDFSHTYTIQPLKRMLLTMQQVKNGCNPSLKKSKSREKFLYFSIPSVFIPGHGITIRKKDAHLFGNPPVSLEKLIKNSHLRLGIVGERSYGTAIDSLLEQYQKSGNIHIRVAQDSYGKQVEMMLADRIDYVLGYPIEFGYIKKKLGDTDQIKFLTVKEATPYSITYVACSKTGSGKKIIEKINEILLEERPSERYRSFVERWLDKDSIPEYRQAYDRIFLTIKD